MKWPTEVTVIRHGESAYNAAKATKAENALYRQFVRAYDSDPTTPVTKRLATQVLKRFAPTHSDYETPLTSTGHWQALDTGRRLARGRELPDVVFHSPYHRAVDTLGALAAGWPGLDQVRWIGDDRIREQEHGLASLYGDRRIFFVRHPEQRLLFEQHGALASYWYQYPQGESAAQVRDRARSFATALIREWAGARVLIITHHLTILSMRANLERLTPERFVELDKTEKPINCGVTTYRGNPTLGRDGKLILTEYNRRHYSMTYLPAR